MRESYKFAREIAKKCFLINEPEDGCTMFDTKLCAQMVEEKFAFTTNKSTSLICSSCKKAFTFGVCHSCHCDALPGD